MMQGRQLLSGCGLLLAGVSVIGISNNAVAQTAAASTSEAARAVAQTSGPTEATGAADIVVTANRRQQTLQDVPMSINVASGEQLERLKIFDAKDVQQLAPGLELSNTQGRNNVATLRGISFDPDQGTKPAVDLYFNEVPIDVQTAFTALYDVDQIEVLRGPQGALRGRTSPAGAITIRTRRPDLTTVDGYIQGTATDDNAYNYQAGVSLPLVEDKIAIRAAVLVDGNQINQVRNVNRNNEVSLSRTESARLSIALQPLENLNINLMYQYLNADNRQNQGVAGPGNAAIGNAPIASSDRLAVTEGLIRNVNNSHLITLNADWDLGPVTLSATGGRQRSKLKQILPGDVTNAIPGYSPPGTLVVPYNVDTAEVRLLSNNDGFWNWTIGAYYNRQTGDVGGPSSFDFIGGVPGVPVPVVIVPVGGFLSVPTDDRTLAIAASSRFKFTNRLTLEVAARYSSLKTRQIATLTLPGVGNLSLVDHLNKYHPLTGSATLTYELSPSLTAYVAYGRAFRGGSAGVGTPQNVSEDLVLTQSEKSDAIEAGIKASLFDRRLSLNISGFYQKFDGYLSRFRGIPLDRGTNIDVTGDGVPDGVYAGPPDGQVDQISDFNYNGDAKIKGVEATLSGRPFETWDVSVSAAYTHARYSNALLPCTTVNGAGQAIIVPNPAFGGTNNVSYCTRSSRISDVPDFSLTANTEVRFPIGDYVPFISALFTLRPSFYSQNVQFRYPSRELLNVFVGLRGPDSRWELSAFARNLLNQSRITDIAASTGQLSGTNVLGGAPVIYDSGYKTVNVTNPREFGLSASFKF